MQEKDKNLMPLSSEEIKKRLKSISGWIFEDNKISKEFKFDNFSDGLFLLTHLAPFCNYIDHHPDIKISYKTFIFELTEHSIGAKVTERDLQVAKKIEELFEIFFNRV